jgi:uncharacterized protein with PIN domain
MNFLALFKKPNLIAAHRGNRSQKPENTLAALVSSIGKCDFIEIDVQLTKDLIPVIIHDDTLARTSNISEIKRFEERKPWRVCDFTEKELQSLDFGSWFNHEYEPMLTLEKALSFAKEHQLFLNVEIKEMSKAFADKTVVQIIIDMIKKTQTEHLVLLSSFYHPYLPLCKKYAHTIPTAALQKYKHPDDLIAYLHSLQVDAYHPAERITKQKIVSDLREAGFFVSVFTVNDIKRQKELFDWGISAVFTNFLETEMKTQAPSYKFIADCHLGKLAKYLRIMGFDTLFFTHIEDDKLIVIAKEEKRIILTRDRELSQRKNAPVLFLDPIDTKVQLITLINYYELKEHPAPFSRCIVCNTPLQVIEKKKIIERIPEKVKKHFAYFEYCHACDRIYWQGDHYRNMIEFLEQVLKEI